MDVLIALADRSLFFASHFRGDTWNAWKAFLAALQALPSSEAQLAARAASRGDAAA